MIAATMMRVAPLRMGGGIAALLVSLALCGAHGCEPRPIERGVCGNRVREGGEACDHFVDTAGLQCGAPGSPWACQFVCESYRCDECCPDENFCGLDGLCKRPTGQFVRASKPLSAGGDALSGAEELIGGDLDGDHRLDVVGVLDENMSVIFGADRDQTPVDHRLVFEPQFLPVIAKRSTESSASSGAGGANAGADDGGVGGAAPAADQPQLADLIVPRAGFVSLRTDDTRALSPVSLPAIPLPTDLDEFALLPVDTTSWRQTLDLIFHAGILGQSALFLIDDYAFSPIAPTHGPPSALSRPALVAQFDERIESRCNDIVLAYAGHDQIEFFNPCRMENGQYEPNTCDGLGNCPEDLPRLLDVGAPVQGGPFAFDVNQDGHLDVVVQVFTSGSSPSDPTYESRVAYGVGNGTFHSDLSTLPPFVPPFDAQGDNQFFAEPTLDPEGQLILALGDFDGNGDADFVLPRDIRRGPDWGIVAFNGSDPWTEAVIADFNGNDIADVIAVSKTGKHAYFFNSVGDGSLNPATIPSDAPLHQLHVGDFDGDLLLDLLALTTVTPPGAEPLNQVQVLFGSPAGPPAAPETLGQTEHDLQLVAGHMASDLTFVLEGIFDGISDIVAVSSIEGALSSMHVFVGRADREIRSPFGLMSLTGANSLELEFRPYLARKVIVGTFDPSMKGDGQLAAIALEAIEPDSDYRVWLVPELQSKFDPRAAKLVDGPLQQREPGSEAVWELGMYAAVDIDLDGVDELVAVAPLPDQPGRSAYRIGRMDTDGWQWFPAAGVGEIERDLYRYGGPTVPCRDPFGHPDGGDCTTGELSSTLSTAFDMPRENGRLQVCNLDGDERGRKELVVLSRAPGRGEPESPSQLFVYAFDGSMALLTDGFQRVDLNLGVDVKLYDVACLEADGQPGDELALVTSEGVHIVHGASTSVPTISGPVPASAGYTRVVTGDVDGDGLVDLVLGSNTDARVFYAAGTPSPEELAP